MVWGTRKCCEDVHGRFADICSKAKSENLSLFRKLGERGSLLEDR